VRGNSIRFPRESAPFVHGATCRQLHDVCRPSRRRKKCAYVRNVFGTQSVLPQVLRSANCDPWHLRLLRTAAIVSRGRRCILDPRAGQALIELDLYNDFNTVAEIGLFTEFRIHINQLKNREFFIPHSQIGQVWPRPNFLPGCLVRFNYNAVDERSLLVGHLDTDHEWMSSRYGYIGCFEIAPGKMYVKYVPY